MATYPTFDEIFDEKPINAEKPKKEKKSIFAQWCPQTSDFVSRRNKKALFIIGTFLYLTAVYQSFPVVARYYYKRNGEYRHLGKYIVDFKYMIFAETLLFPLFFPLYFPSVMIKLPFDCIIDFLTYMTITD